MQVIHFTHGATDPLENASRSALIDLANGRGDTRISCLHLAAGAEILEPPATHDCAVLLVHGRITLAAADTGLRLELLAGVGVLVKTGERYTLESEQGAILLVVEAQELKATRQGISTPQRITGQRWPGDAEVGSRMLPAPGSGAPHAP